MPACRMPPPKSLRSRRARRIASAEPASAEPTGAPSPLEKQIETVSKCCAHSPRRMPAGHDRVHEPGTVQVHRQVVLASPSSDLRDALERVNPAAPAIVRVFQADQPRSNVVSVMDWAGSRRRCLRAARSRRRLRTSARSRPRAGRSRRLPRRRRATSTSTSSSSPGWVFTPTPIWLAIVPEGTKTAASLPSSSAVLASRSLTVGSSP